MSSGSRPASRPFVPEVDPWDETPVTFPRGMLALLVQAATEADSALLLGDKCDGDPCAVCTALVEGYEAVHDL